MVERRSKSDGFMLRLPPGLRDRVKSYAEANGRSMNSEIIRLLEREFPEPLKIEDRVSDLESLLSVFRGARSNEALDRLANSIKETIEDIVMGKVYGLSDSEQEAIRAEQLTVDLDYRTFQDQSPETLDAEERDQLMRTGTTAKIVRPKED